MTAPELDRYRRYLLAEWEAATLYRKLAGAESHPERASVLQSLADIEERHAARWQARLQAAGSTIPPRRVTFRTRCLIFFAGVLGTQSVLPLLERLEGADAAMYDAEPDAQDFSRQERDHRRIVATLPGRRGLAPLAGGEGEHRHRHAGALSLRAGVFGMNDGLLSNMSLIMGVAGADPGRQVILLAGIAGLMAGAFSMAVGEYVSVRAQRELFERELELERAEMEEDPEEEERELSLIYQSKGLTPGEAQILAQRIMSNKEAALDTLAREELGINPRDLGSPLTAAGSSFVSFTVGALLPVLPYVLTSDPAAFWASALLSGVGLAAIGIVTAVLSGRSMLAGALRVLLLGAAAAAVTHLAGRLVGVALL